MVITPSHEESRVLFDKCVHGQATIDQYALYNHIGYYSTELYELSQAAPVFVLGDEEENEYFLYFKFILNSLEMSWTLLNSLELSRNLLPNHL